MAKPIVNTADVVVYKGASEIIQVINKLTEYRNLKLAIVAEVLRQLSIEV